MSDQISKIKDIKQKKEKEWLAVEGVVAVGIGNTAAGGLGIIVSIKKNAAKIRAQIPASIEDVPIEIQETGEIKAL